MGTVLPYFIIVSEGKELMFARDLDGVAVSGIEDKISKKSSVLNESLTYISDLHFICKSFEDNLHFKYYVYNMFFVEVALLQSNLSPVNSCSCMEADDQRVAHWGFKPLERRAAGEQTVRDSFGSEVGGMNHCLHRGTKLLCKERTESKDPLPSVWDKRLFN